MAGIESKSIFDIESDETVEARLDADAYQAAGRVISYERMLCVAHEAGQGRKSSTTA